MRSWLKPWIARQRGKVNSRLQLRFRRVPGRKQEEAMGRELGDTGWTEGKTQDARGFFLGSTPVAETGASDFQGLFSQQDKGHTDTGSNLGFWFTAHSPKFTCWGVFCKHCVHCSLHPFIPTALLSGITGELSGAKSSDLSWLCSTHRSPLSRVWRPEV